MASGWRYRREFIFGYQYYYIHRPNIWMVESSIPVATATVAAPIRKLCPALWCCGSVRVSWILAMKRSWVKMWEPMQPAWCTQSLLPLDQLHYPVPFKSSAKDLAPEIANFGNAGNQSRTFSLSWSQTITQPRDNDPMPLESIELQCTGFDVHGDLICSLMSGFWGSRRHSRTHLGLETSVSVKYSNS